MRNWLLTVLLACLAGTVLFIFLRQPIQRPSPLPVPPATDGALSAHPVPISMVISNSAGTKITADPIAPLAYLAPTQSPPATVPPLTADLLNVSPTTVLENMRTTFRQYASVYGGNPVGSNPEITRALAGDNPKQINFLKPDGNRVNSNGELVDVWGTPYFFHQLSGTLMEIRSAGPDRKMWTDDDLVFR